MQSRCGRWSDAHDRVRRAERKGRPSRRARASRSGAGTGHGDRRAHHARSALPGNALLGEGAGALRRCERDSPAAGIHALGAPAGACAAQSSGAGDGTGLEPRGLAFRGRSGARACRRAGSAVDAARAEIDRGSAERPMARGDRRSRRLRALRRPVDRRRAQRRVAGVDGRAARSCGPSLARHSRRRDQLGAPRAGAAAARVRRRAAPRNHDRRAAREKRGALGHARRQGARARAGRARDHRRLRPDRARRDHGRRPDRGRRRDAHDPPGGRGLPLVRACGSGRARCA